MQIIFKKYYSDGDIKEINRNNLPLNVIDYFERRNRLFIDPKKYKIANFEKYFVINHPNNQKTYLAQTTKQYYANNEIDRLTYFVTVDENNNLINKAELRLNISCKKENLSYFKDKPFCSWIKTKEEFRRQGLATRVLKIMYAFSLAFYNLPLYSDTVLLPEFRNLMQKLVKEGKAKKFFENANKYNIDRYKFCF